MPVRLVVADDHALFRAGLRGVLERAGFLVVAEAADGHETLRVVGEHHPDAVLLDISMPGLNGMEVAGRLKRDHPEVKVLMVSVHRDEAYVARSLRAGADGYLLKDAGVEELRVALSAIMEGRMYLSPGVAKPVIHDYLERGARAGSEEEYHRLTPRQVEVLQLVGEGHTTKEIADVLHLSPRTVESHRKQLMIALDAPDLAGLVRSAIRLKLVDP